MTTFSTVDATAALTLDVLRPAADRSSKGESNIYDRLALVGTVDHTYPNNLSREVTALKANLRVPTSTVAALQLPPSAPWASCPVALVVRNMGQTVLFHLAPVDYDAELGAWTLRTDKAGPTMAGSNYAHTSDSRLSAVLAAFLPASEGPSFAPPVRVHDWTETWGQYNSMD